MAGIAGQPSIVTSGLVFYLDAANRKSFVSGSKNWIDLSNNNYTGSLKNGVGYSGTNLGSLVFDGTNDYVSASSISSLFTGDMTAEAWIKLTAFSGDWVRIIGTAKTSGDDRTFGIWYWVDGGILWQRTGGTNPNMYSTSPKLTVGSWTYVAATTSGTSHALYLNGVSIGTATAAGPWTASGQPITVGYAGFHTYTNSSISGVKLYTRGLTAAEILQNYNATKVRFGL